MEHSKYQKMIHYFIKNGSGNAVVSAVAGSGKTTTIVESLKMLPRDIDSIFLAFNKSIASELKVRVPIHTETSTLHSLGWKAMYRSYGGNITLDDRKMIKIIRKKIKDEWKDIKEQNYAFQMEYTESINKLINLLRVNLISTEKDLEKVAANHDIEFFNGECGRAFEVLDEAFTDLEKFDFTDMIFMPAIDDSIHLKKYDIVFVDEAQDLNRAQQRLIEKTIKPKTGRFIAVGDPRQAIYGFAGADVASFNRLQNQPNTKSLPLSICYRCGRKIIEKAKTIVPDIEWFEGAGEGLVRYDGKNEDINDGDYVLCRNTAPLVQLLLDLISIGKKAHILGSDIGLNLIKFIKKSDTATMGDLYQFLFKKFQDLQDKLKKFGYNAKEVNENEQCIKLREKIHIIQIIEKSFQCNSVNAIIKKIEGIFTDSKDGIVLSTVHKSKGLEADTVHIISPELMPSRYAKQDWEKEQEKNLMYVAYTRAKKELIFNDEFIFNENGNAK